MMTNVVMPRLWSQHTISYSKESWLPKGMGDFISGAGNVQYKPGTSCHTGKQSNYQRQLKRIQEPTWIGSCWQRWYNLSINKDSNCNGLNHIKYVYMHDFIMILTWNSLANFEDTSKPTCYFENRYTVKNKHLVYFLQMNYISG